MEQNKVSFQNPKTGEPLSLQKEIDEMFMRRCLQLAKNGRQNAKPNPMVGAVIVSEEGRIIGEGYHVRCGEGHAEVNAFASIKPEDEHLLKQSHYLRESRTLFSLRQDASLCRLDRKKRSKEMCLRLRRSFRQGAGPRNPENSRGRHRSNGGRSRGGMSRTQQALHHLQYPSATLHHPEMGADCEWLSG